MNNIKPEVLYKHFEEIEKMDRESKEEEIQQHQQMEVVDNDEFDKKGKYIFSLYLL